MLKKDVGNDLQEILTQAIEQMKVEQAEKFDLQKINLAELERRTGITRAKLRRLKANGFIIKPHGNTGKKASATVLSGFTGVIDDLLRSNVTNAVSVMTVSVNSVIKEDRRRSGSILNSIRISFRPNASLYLHRATAAGVMRPNPAKHTRWTGAS